MAWKSIRKAVRWRHESTFTKHFNKTILPVGAFRQTILNSCAWSQEFYILFSDVLIIMLILSWNVATNSHAWYHTSGQTAVGELQDYGNLHDKFAIIVILPGLCCLASWDHACPPFPFSVMSLSYCWDNILYIYPKGNRKHNFQAN